MDSDYRENNLEERLLFIAKSSLIVFIGIITSKLSTYIYKFIIARHFGPSNYGLFSITLMILTFFVALSSFGIPEGIVRFISIYRGKKEFNKIIYLFKYSFGFLLISGLFFSFLLFISSELLSVSIFKNVNLIPFLRFSGIIVFFYLLSGLFLAFIRAFEKISFYSFLLNILQNIIKLISLILLILLGFETNSIILSYFLGIFTIFIISYYYCIFKLKIINKKYSLIEKDKDIIKRELFSYSLPLIFTNILIIFYYWIDSFLIGYLNIEGNGIYNVGIYNAAIPIALLFTISQDFFIQSFFPLMTREYSRKNFKLIEEMSKQIAKWIFMFNLPLFMIMLIFPGTLINFLFGPEYMAALTSLRILSIGGFLSSFSAINSSILLTRGKSKILLFNFTMTSIINIVLDLILIPKMGINGAAIATTIVWIFLSVILFIEVKLNSGSVILKREIFKIFLISLAPTSLVLLIKQTVQINITSLFLLGLFFILTYIILLLITKSFDEKDIFIIKRFKNKLYHYSFKDS